MLSALKPLLADALDFQQAPVDLAAQGFEVGHSYHKRCFSVFAVFRFVPTPRSTVSTPFGEFSRGPILSIFTAIHPRCCLMNKETRQL
jgi:hypothetical protein